ncbi:MAG TPA: type II toxin-antitoxin system VapC family toxin [Mycobacteriales bacterium]|nr:type II toxin-antitoxin system VapC family toxin [Mycobacteriales bacterium]
MIVVDASVLANVIADDGPDGQLARSELRDADGAAIPDLADVETVAVLRKRWLAGELSARRFATAIDDLEELDLQRYPTLPLMHRAYELRSNVTAYDAAYVALAEALDAELVTADSRLANATGPRCPIRVLQPPGYGHNP